jgi:hypothetical protein
MEEGYSFFEEEAMKHDAMLLSAAAFIFLGGFFV